MKRLVLVLGFAVAAWGQNPPASGLQPVSSPTPGGSCTNSQPAFYSTADQNLYTCQSGTWTVVGGGSGGGLTNVGISAPSTIFTVGGAAATANGTRSLSYATGQTANLIFGTNSSGNVGLMNLTLAQLPTAIPLTQLATQSANTVVGALTATTPSALALPSCSGATNALIWTSGTGFGCNTISGGLGTVTSVTFTGDGTVLSSTPSTAVTTSGTVTGTLLTQTANFFLAGPTTGAAANPTFRAMVSADLPTASTSLFGGFKDFAAVTHQWAKSSSGGVVTLSQPASSDLSDTANIALLNAAQTFSAAQTINVAGVASTSSLLFSGTWYTGGTATTTKPKLLIEPSGTTSTNWNTSGTGIGVNAASGFTGNLLDLQRNGVSEANITYTGTLTLPSSGGGVQGPYYQDVSSSKGFWGTTTSGINWVNINRTTTNVNIQIQQKASQTADLLQFTNSAGTTQSGFNAAGFQYLDPIATASLPTCTTTSHAWRASVNDATAPALGVALTGGGSTFATVHCSLTTGTYFVDGL